MTRYLTGNIFDTKCRFIAHGVATGSQEGMGTGLALKISRKWQDAQKLFKKYTRNHKFKGGDLFVVEPTSERPGIIYIATQPDMYRAKLSYLRHGIKNLRGYCEKENIKSVALPKIGAGLGKLDWNNEVKPLLESELAESFIVFDIYEVFTNNFENE